MRVARITPRSWSTLTSAPSFIIAKVKHELMRLPSTRTVQAPHCPWSHPFFAPVKSNCSRNRSSNVVQGAISNCFSAPLTLSVIEFLIGALAGTFPMISPSDLLSILKSWQPYLCPLIRPLRPHFYFVKCEYGTPPSNDNARPCHR